MKEITIALIPKVYSDINIQLTLNQLDNNSYINSVNIIYKKKIIKKIKITGPRRKYTLENVESITSSFFNNLLMSSKASEQEVNKQAKKRASSNLMNEFNI